MNPHLSLAIVLALWAAATAASPLDGLIQKYRNATGALDPERGAAAWTRPWPASDGKLRRCSDCHGNDLTRAGRHLRTGKPIPPLAPSVNPDALSDPGKVEKWLHRNCRWTWGRECTPREQGDLILFLADR
jgi:hypothetical protein